MKVYHYTRFDCWEAIQSGGLRVQRPWGRGSIGKEAIFAFFEPLPEDWLGNPFFPYAWEYIKDHMGHLLLEIEVDTEKDKPFVADAGYYVAAEYGFNREIAPRKYLQWYPNLIDSRRKSLVPLKKYLQKKEELDYALPEVVFFKRYTTR